jgi:hypothetical protein
MSTVIAKSIFRRGLSLALLALPVVVSARVHAQDVAAAEALFRAGRELLAKGDYAAACPKLVESNRLDPSSGAALNVALCHLKQGKTATAWAEYVAAARLARQQHKPEREDEATKKAAELEKELSHITILVTQPVAGLEVRRDDVTVAASSFGTSLPIDPGEHVVTASAPGYKTVKLQATVGGDRDARTITIPALEKVPERGSPTIEKESEGAAAPPSKSGAGPAPWVVGGLGIVALGVGGTFGVLALTTYHSATTACPTRMNCSSDALNTRSRANTFANVANVGIGVGAAGVVVGAILLATSPRSKASSDSALVIEPIISHREAGLGLTGRF